MNANGPRLRMFAGPNGSGKSTLKSVIRPDLLGVYINPDEIEKSIRESNRLSLIDFYVRRSPEQVIEFLKNSSLLKQANLLQHVDKLSIDRGTLEFNTVPVNSYFASVISDLIRSALLEQGISLTCETVMSSPDKIDLLKTAQSKGYRTYLYYVATESPLLNIDRVRNRVRQGGHSVPEEKIITRYARSLDLLAEAIRHTDRAYIFDNSADSHLWIAEVTNGTQLEFWSDDIPQWFKKYVLEKIQ